MRLSPCAGRLLAGLILLLVASGCAAVPYRYSGPLENREIWRDTPQVETGRPNGFLDTVGNVVSVPAKLLLLSSRVDNHRISAETAAAIEAYLQQNDLRNVKVRLNQYAPGGEWIRLFRNRTMNIGWRATLGVLTTAMYTVFPGRVFGGDNFNPFTNTISLYSDHPAIALHEAGHAKDFSERRYKGIYAATRLLPLVPLYQEAKATGDAVGYLRDRQSAQEEKNAYKILYPAYCTYVGGEFLNLVPVGGDLYYLIQYGAVIPGHIAGRLKAAMVDEPLPPAQPSGGTAEAPDLPQQGPDLPAVGERDAVTGFGQDTAAGDVGGNHDPVAPAVDGEDRAAGTI